MSVEDRTAARPGLVLAEVPHPNDGEAEVRPPAKYSKGLHMQIVQLIQQGQHPETAARACGIGAAAFAHWMRRGAEEGEDSVMGRFAADVDQAFALAEVGATKIVVEASLEDPKFAAWWLERAASERWNKATQVIVRNELEAFLEKLEQGLPAHLYEQVLRCATGEPRPAEVGQEDAKVH